MVADWHDGFVLRSIWMPESGGKVGSYRLILGNRGLAAIEGFRLGISGPARINEAAEIRNGRVVTQLSNYAELAPPSGFVLEPGAEWIIEIGRLDYPLRHWTDGATTGFVILADGRAVPATTHPTERPDVSEP
jgi:hexosaminidase